MSMLHYAAMNIQLPRTSSGHSQHQSSFNDQTIGGKSRTSHHLARCASARPGILRQLWGATSKRDMPQTCGGQPIHAQVIPSNSLSLSLSVAVYQCIGLFIYTHLLYIYIYIYIYIYVCMPERNFVKLISHDGYPQIWSVRQINSQCMANSQCRAKTLRPGLCPFYCILLYHLHTSLGLCAVHALPDFPENVYSTFPSDQCSSVFAKQFQSVPVMPRQCNVALLKTLPRHPTKRQEQLLNYGYPYPEKV